MLVFSVFLIATIATTLQLFGCFALFTLDEYKATPNSDAAIDSPSTEDVPIVKEASTDAPLPSGKIVFVTNAPYAVDSDQMTAGAISGVKAADALCGAAAADAGLNGQFLAWISGVASSPSTTFASLIDAQAPAQQLITPTHQIIASSYAELARDGPRVPIVVTETNMALPEGLPKEAGAGSACPTNEGGGVGGGLVWTATDERGVASSPKEDDCDNWRANGAVSSARVGRLVKNRLDWTKACVTPCNVKAHLYCFEQ